MSKPPPGPHAPHEFGQLYHDFLNEKTILPKKRNPSSTQWEYTHIRVRKAYNSLIHLHRKKWLFTFLQPPKNALQPKRWKATTNSLEGGINAQLKTPGAHTPRPWRGETTKNDRMVAALTNAAA